MSLFRTEKQKMLAGESYHADDAELKAERNAASARLVRYNAALGASDASTAPSSPSTALMSLPWRLEREHRSAPRSRSTRQTIHAIHRSAGRVPNSGALSGLVRMCGSAVARSFYRV